MPLHQTPAPPAARAASAAEGLATGGHRRDRAAFLRGFLRHPAQVGSVAPSSGWLEQRLVRAADIAQAKTVVELGPGTGGTTAALLRAMAPSARLLALEVDPGFHRLLCQRLRDPRLALHLAGAQDLAESLATHGLPAPDAIVSGIPFSTLPPATADAIAAAIARVLRPGGRFVAYQVRASVADYTAPYLGPPRRTWEWLNLPPVRVFTWVRSA